MSEQRHYDDQRVTRGASAVPPSIRTSSRTPRLGARAGSGVAAVHPDPKAAGRLGYICTMHRQLRGMIFALATGLILMGCRGEVPLHGMVVDPPSEAPVVRVTGEAPFDLDKERRAHSVVLYFGYTHCPDVCPATLADWARAKKELGSAAVGVRFVFVSVDPERDTPQIARSYAQQFDPSFVGIAPTAAQVDSLKENWGFAVMRDSTPEMKKGEYGVTHPAGSFVIDRAGRIREILPPNTPAADIASDLRRIK